MRRRIGLYLGSTPQQGGIFQYSQSVLEALSHLPAARYQPFAICATELWQQQAEACGIEAVSVRVSDLERGLAALWLHGMLPASPWRRWIARRQPGFRKVAALDLDLILYPAHDRWSYLWPLPALAAVHDLMHRYERRFPEVGGLYRLREAHHHSIAAYCRAALVDSDCGRKQFCESYAADASRVFVLPYIAPAAVRQASTEDRTPAGLPAKYFFYPAQFWPHKNHSRLLRALSLVARRHPDVQLVLTGSKAHEYPRLQAQVRQLHLSGQVHFLGYVPELGMHGLYRRARALVMPTFFGPTNIPPLEAFALDCPVAISGIYGMPDQLGDAALYFDPESEESIAAVMERLWVDDALREELIQRGRQHAEQWGQAAFAVRLAECIDASLSTPAR